MTTDSKIIELANVAFAMEIEDAKSAGALGFMGRALIQATLPHTDPGTRDFIRRNGDFTLSLSSHKDYGLPYGVYPRLLLCWLTTEAVRTKQPTLHLGGTLTAFMRELGLHPTGGRWGSMSRFKSQMIRLFTSNASCVYEAGAQTTGIGAQVAKRFDLWWDPKQPDHAMLWDSTVTLTKDFFEELTTRPVPLDLRAYRALRRSPLQIDLYTWLTYRLSYLRKTTTIPWGSLQHQFGSSYPTTSQGRSDFRQAFKRALKRVSLLIPSLQADISPLSFTLYPNNQVRALLEHDKTSRR